METNSPQPDVATAAPDPSEQTTSEEPAPIIATGADPNDASQYMLG